MFIEPPTVLYAVNKTRSFCTAFFLWLRPKNLGQLEFGVVSDEDGYAEYLVQEP